MPLSHPSEIRVKVVVARCPYLQQRVAELWLGTTPVVPANAYLRSKLNARERTLIAIANRLRPFFEFLRENDFRFWDRDVRLGGQRMLLFRNTLLARARRANAQRLSFSSARAILHAVFALCEFWRQPGEPPIAVEELTDSRGAFPHKTRWSHRLPPAFTIRVPAGETHRQNHVLLPSEVEAIWRFLTREAAPPVPDLLRRHPRGPRPEWPARRTRAWERARQQFATRLAWFRRQQMLWAILIATGMRRAEIPLLMVADVEQRDEQLWVRLRPRATTAHLGDAKSGGRSMFAGWDERVVQAWRNWMLSRGDLVDAWMRRTGKADHGMLLVGRDGGPITTKGMASLFAGLNRHFGTFGEDDNRFSLHAHAIRHTVESLFRDWGVPLEVRQQHLGHKRPETTLSYGQTYRERYVEFLSQLDRRLGETTATYKAR